MQTPDYTLFIFFWNEWIQCEGICYEEEIASPPIRVMHIQLGHNPGQTTYWPSSHWDDAASKGQPVGSQPCVLAIFLCTWLTTGVVHTFSGGKFLAMCLATIRKSTSQTTYCFSKESRLYSHAPLLHTLPIFYLRLAMEGRVLQWIHCLHRLITPVWLSLKDGFEAKNSREKLNQIGSSIAQVVKNILKSTRSLVADGRLLTTYILRSCLEMSWDVCRSFLSACFDSEHALCPPE